MAKRHEKRFERLEQFIASKGLSAIIVSHFPNIRYFTGFSGGEGVFVASPPEYTLFVDARYTLRARAECQDVTVTEAKRPLEAAIRYLNEKIGGRVGLETAHLTVDRYRYIRRNLHGIGIKSLKDQLDTLRMVKDATEISLIEHAIDIHTRALNDTLAWLSPGMTERQWAVEFEYRARRLGAEALSFDPIVASGPRAAIPHATADPVPLEPAGPVIFDHGVVYNGYCSDETATFFTAPPTSELAALYQVVKEAHDQAVEAVKPGIRASSIDAVARRMLEDAGVGAHFTHGTGHGVGLEIHERPAIGPKDKTILEPGMVFTVEPGIYFNGKLGIRIEDMVLVTADGCRVLTKRPKSLTVLFE